MVGTSDPSNPARLIRAAIVGTGYIAEFHARAIQPLEDVGLVGVCDPNLKSAESFARSWAVPRAFDSLKSMLANQKIDCVHLLAPPDHHFSLAKLALDSGVHVLLEKPMCTSVAEANELIGIARERGLYLGVSHNFLFSSAYERLREVIKSGALGPIDHLTFNHFFELAQIRLGPHDSWMLRRPGNVIFETGPHLVSAMIDLVGMPGSLSVIGRPERHALPNNAEVQADVGASGLPAGRIAVDININFAPGFPATIHSRSWLVRGSAVVDLMPIPAPSIGRLHWTSTSTASSAADEWRVKSSHASLENPFRLRPWKVQDCKAV